jgi:hypothetical protein
MLASSVAALHLSGHVEPHARGRFKLKSMAFNVNALDALQRARHPEAVAQKLLCLIAESHHATQL